MAKKLDYERALNQIFGTNIKWSKLSTEELVELATILNHPEVLLEKLEITNEYKRKLLIDRFIEATTDLLKEWEGPVATLLKKFMKEEKQPTT